MSDLSYLAIAYCCIVIVLAYAARGSTGFGAAAAMPLMGLVIPMKVLVPAWTLLGICAGITILGGDRKNIAWREIAKLLPTCMIGIALGLYVFTALDARTLAQGLGVLVVLYGAYSLWTTLRPPLKPNVAAGVIAPIAGIVGGFVGTAFGTMASLFFAIYFDVTRLAKDWFRATMTALLLALTVTRGIGYWAVGEYTREVMIMFAVTLPMMLAGIFIGNRINARIDETMFRRLVSAILIVSGVALIVK